MQDYCQRADKSDLFIRAAEENGRPTVVCSEHVRFRDVPGIGDQTGVRVSVCLHVLVCAAQVRAEQYLSSADYVSDIEPDHLLVRKPRAVPFRPLSFRRPRQRDIPGVHRDETNFRAADARRIREGAGSRFCAGGHTLLAIPKLGKGASRSANLANIFAYVRKAAGGPKDPVDGDRFFRARRSSAVFARDF